MTPRKTRNAATVSDEDLRLFEQAVGKVRRMIDPGVLPARPAPPPEPVQSRLDEARVPAELMRSLIDPAEIEVGEESELSEAGTLATAVAPFEARPFQHRRRNRPAPDDDRSRACRDQVVSQ
jgi:hypothetical protein